MEPKPKTLLDAVKAYAVKDVAISEAAESRWVNGITCVHCGADSPMFIRTRLIWKCRACRKQFSFKAGTIMEDSPLGLDKWLPAVWLIANSRNGISSWELHRALGVTQKTAWFMLHRIRLAMQDDLTGGTLNGEIEVDESFMGGKARNMHKDKRDRLKASGELTTASGGKSVVLRILERASEKKPKRVRATVISDRKKKTLAPEVEAAVEPGSTIYSDEFGYSWANEGRHVHEMVNHAEKYVSGNCHTNGLENFWSLLKRGISGIYVSVEPFHLYRYIEEQAFRFNNRLDAGGEVISDYERFKAALSQVVGKRLTYRALTGEEGASTSTEVPF